MIVARLMTSGLVAETKSAESAEPHPGLARKYYMLTARGRTTLAAEANRLKRTAAVAERRLGVVRGRS